MKKNMITLGLLAASSMMAMGSAQAIELYNKDGVSVDLKGDIEVRYQKDFSKDSSLKQVVDDADFGFDTRYEINDDLKIGAYFEFSGADNDKTLRVDDNSAVGDVYVALYSNSMGSLKVGKLATVLDDVGITEDFIFGVQSIVSDADFSGEEVIRYDYDNGQFYFGLALNQDKHNAQRIGEDGSYFDGKIGYRVNDFDFTGFFGVTDEEGTDGQGNALNNDVSLFALEGRYAGFDNLNLGAAYYTVNVDVNNSGESSVDTIALAADYTFSNQVNVAGGLSFTDFEGGEDLNNWFVNASRSIAPNTLIYVEIGGDDAEDSELGYGVGIKAEF